MRLALLILLPALSAQAEPWLLRFNGFTSTQGVKAEALDKLFREQLEGMSDEPKAGFQVLDEGHVDITASATEVLEGDEFIFHWYLTMTECPGRTFDYEARLSKKILNKTETRKMLGELVAQAVKVKDGKAGKRSLTCTEDGDAYADMPSNTAEPSDKPKPKPKPKK
ncbi:MAG: hypothetical protein QM723_10780 [Myxococcaceae bacterium]